MWAGDEEDDEDEEDGFMKTPSVIQPWPSRYRVSTRAKSTSNHPP